MNVDPFLQLRLLDLQAKDTRLDQIAHKARTLPAAARVAELEAQAQALADRLVAAETIAADLRREQAKAEADVQQVVQRAARDRQLLDSGTINDAKQLQSLQAELVSLARRQSDLEDVQLEVMERLEGAEAACTVLTRDRAAVGAQVGQAEVERDEALAGLEDEAAQVRAERAALAEGLPADLIALYEKLRAGHDGLAAAALFRGRCEGCRIQLTPTDIGRIRTAPPDEVLRCEECRRILVRTPDSGL